MRTAVCACTLSWMQIFSTASDARSAQLMQSEQIELAGQLARTIGSYQDTAFWCHQGGAFSYAEYVTYRSRAAATLALGVGSRDAYLLVDGREERLLKNLPPKNDLADTLSARGMTAGQLRSSCDASMTEYEYEIGVARAKLGLMK